MIVNLISNLDETARINQFYTFNHVVAWSLKEAFEEYGVICRFVRDHSLKEETPPLADHSIVISGIAMRLIRDSKVIRKRVRDSTAGKMTMYLDADFGQWHKIFDYIFSVVEPIRKEPQFVYGGWGADPKYFYPEQEERALYLDSLMYDKYNGRFDHIYDTYYEVMAETSLTVHFPIPEYNKRYNLIYWPTLQGIIRKCHYYCCTQLGESGLTRIESATSGALLVVPEELYRSRTMSSLEHRIWSTKGELMDILATNTDPLAIREKALRHSWSKVAQRMLDVFEG